MKGILKKSAAYQIFAAVFLGLFLVGGAVKGMWLESLPAWERRVMVLDMVQSLSLIAAFSCVCALGHFVRGNQIALYIFEACIVCAVADLTQLAMWILLPEKMLQTAYAENWGFKTAGSVLAVGIVLMLAWTFVRVCRSKKNKN